MRNRLIMPGRAPRDSANMIGHATEDTTVTGFAEYERYDGTGLAELVRRRQVSPSELLEAAIARVEARNRAVNAVTMPLYDYGRAAISKGLPDGPFTGVPFLMKDLSAAIAGVPMTRSSRFFADAPAKNRELRDRKSTRLNSSHLGISYAVFCLKKKKKIKQKSAFNDCSILRSVRRMVQMQMAGTITDKLNSDT